MKRLTLSLLTLISALSVGVARPAFSASLVRPIPIAQAQGGGASFSVWPGSGTNIDFTRTGEVIQKVWLDNPSRIGIDFDGPLDGSGGQGQETGASVIHLRRLTGISFPNLPQTATTLLSVVTRTSGGGQKVYQFEVTYGSGSPQYATVAIMPESSGALAGGATAEVVISGGRRAALVNVEMGLRQAIIQGIIAADSPVADRAQEFIARVRNGDTVQSAADTADISMAIVSRLAELGLPRATPPAVLVNDTTETPTVATTDLPLTTTP